MSEAFLTSFNPILYKRMLSDSGPVAVVWSVIGLALPLLALTTFAFLPALPEVDALFVLGILGSATLNTLAHLASARSLTCACATGAGKLADASLVTPLLTFSPVFTLLISAIFLGETPEARGLIGVVLVLVGARVAWLNRWPESGWLTPFQSVSAKPGVGLVLFAGMPGLTSTSPSARSSSPTC